MGDDGLRALDALFTLRVNLWDGTRLLVTAFDMAQFREDGTPIYGGTHHAITWQATHVRADGSRETVWEKCQSYHLGIPAHQTIDGHDAKEGVLHSLSMKPGDTDAEFFEGWTEAQIAFGETYGETLALISEERYGVR